MAKTLTKAELSDSLLNDREIKISKDNAKKLVDDFFEVIKGTLEKGENVKISGFGKFKLRDKKARPGRNPKTGEDKIISARRVVTFMSGQKLKSLVNKT